MDTIHELTFQKGFNTGYVLQMYEPTLANLMHNKLNTPSSYISGLLLGIKEVQKEQSVIQEFEQIRKRSDLDFDRSL